MDELTAMLVLPSLILLLDFFLVEKFVRHLDNLYLVEGRDLGRILISRALTFLLHAGIVWVGPRIPSPWIGPLPVLALVAEFGLLDDFARWLRRQPPWTEEISPSLLLPRVIGSYVVVATVVTSYVSVVGPKA
ncbi:MAG: hypothetical protein M4579_007056 [Chaenotheca gracillima]|nr:MAG: hypothetical protein M4579_007056 [Chaenotheca gracillima]